MTMPIDSLDIQEATIASNPRTLMLLRHKPTAGPQTILSTSSRLGDDGNVEVSLEEHHADESVVKASITTTAAECGWNVHASAKLPKPLHLSNRAHLVDVTNNGKVFRVGNCVFTPSSDPAHSPHMRFTPAKFSLYIDDIEQHGKYLFVTSRQDITTVPEPDDKSVEDVGSKSKGEKPDVKDGQLDVKDMNKTSPSDNVEIPSNTSEDKSSSSNLSVADDDDSSDDDHELPVLESEDEDKDQDEDEGSSAEESWSEGSTEYDSDIKLAEFRPQRPSRQAQPSDSASENSESLHSDSSVDDTDSDEEALLEGRDKGVRDLDWDDDSRFLESYWQDSRNDAPSDKDSSNSSSSDADEPADAWEDYLRKDFNAVASDSEECSECGEDGGSCALPPTKSSAPASLPEADSETPIGTPLAQIHVYDMSAFDQDKGPKRIFYFARSTEEVMYQSPPAVHPTKSLLVWPLGDGKILFADYENNTFFVRKFPMSQFWSTHVSINCRFSTNGKYLHVVALEKSGGAPPRLVKKSKKDASDGKPKLKEEEPRYELIASTYRMSSRKTTKAPPQLVGRIQTDLGELTVLPSTTWSEDAVFVAATHKTTCDIYRVKFIGYSKKSKFARGKKLSMSTVAVNLPDWAFDRELSFSPEEDTSRTAKLVIAAEQQKIPWYKAPKTSTSENADELKGAEDFKDDSTTKTSPANAIPSNINDEQVATDKSTDAVKSTSDTDSTSDTTATPDIESLSTTTCESEKEKEESAAAEEKKTSEPVKKEKGSNPKISPHPDAMVAILDLGEASGGGWGKVGETSKGSEEKRDLKFQTLRGYLGIQ